MVKFHESRGEVSPRQRDCKRNVHDVALDGGTARIPIVQKMEQRFTELVAVSSTHTETVLTTSWEGGTMGLERRGRTNLCSVLLSTRRLLTKLLL